MGLKRKKPEPIEHVTYECPVCGDFFKSREICQAGIDHFVPPDPLPLGSRVHGKGEGDDPFWQGVVTESEVRNAEARTGGHRHVRWGRVKHGRGASSPFTIEEGWKEKDLDWELVPA